MAPPKRNGTKPNKPKRRQQRAVKRISDRANMLEAIEGGRRRGQKGRKK